MKQTINEILKLLKFSQDKYTLYYDSEKELFFINGMDINNNNLLNTHNIKLANNNNLYEYALYKNNDAKKSINYFLTEKDITFTIYKDDYNSFVLTIGENEEIVLDFHKINIIIREPEDPLNLEYKNLKLDFKDLKKLMLLGNDLKFNIKSNCFKLESGNIIKEYETSKSIYIDFINKYDLKQIKNFLKYLTLIKAKPEFLTFEISRDAPILLKFEDVKYYLAPKLED